MVYETIFWLKDVFKYFFSNIIHIATIVSFYIYFEIVVKYKIEFAIDEIYIEFLIMTTKIIIEFFIDFFEIGIDNGVIFINCFFVFFF